MTLYLQEQQSSVTWPEPLESTWQLLGGECACDLAPKLPHLGLADILFYEFASHPTTVGHGHLDVRRICAVPTSPVCIGRTG
jgi:hypothetical protein